MSFAEGAHAALCSWGLLQGRAKNLDDLYFRGVHGKKKKREKLSAAVSLSREECVM